jgi:hypothetical protein
LTTSSMFKESRQDTGKSTSKNTQKLFDPLLKFFADPGIVRKDEVSFNPNNPNHKATFSKNSVTKITETQTDEEAERLEKLAKEIGAISAGTSRVGPSPVEPSEVSDQYINAGRSDLKVIKLVKQPRCSFFRRSK